MKKLNLKTQICPLNRSHTDKHRRALNLNLRDTRMHHHTSKTGKKRFEQERNLKQVRDNLYLNKPRFCSPSIYSLGNFTSSTTPPSRFQPLTLLKLTCI
jgi:hypothetical protein